MVWKLVSVIVMVCVMQSPARADNRGNFAHFFRLKPAELIGVVGYKLEKTKDYSHVLLGSWNKSGYKHHGLVLMQCTENECSGKTVYLSSADEVFAIGQVDLRGKETIALKGRSPVRNAAYSQYTTLERLGAKGKRQKWPALVLQGKTSKTAEAMSRFGGKVVGTRRRDELIIVSLRLSGANPIVFREASVDRAPTGAGRTVEYRLERAGKKTRTKNSVMKIHAVEQRHIDSNSGCVRPEPTHHYFQFDNGKFRRATALMPKHGCH